MNKVWSVRRRISIFILIAFFLWYNSCLPKNLFKRPFSTVLSDSKGNVLNAQIANDGQWRFPASDKVPTKIATCLVQFEDRNFYRHCGVSVKGIMRAIVANVKQKRVVSGASTISMQCIRLHRKNPPRTWTEKLYEMVLATRLEVQYSKKEILTLYASHAPFGNNIVGVDAAAWRYFGKASHELSWAESATLAVLPNAPGLIYPGRNQDKLLKKRNRLLGKLFAVSMIDSTTYQLAVQEQLPGKPFPLPQKAAHLMQLAIKQNRKGQLLESTLNIELQQQATTIMATYQSALENNFIYNGSILIADVKTGNVIAYVGNMDASNVVNANDVDCIQAPRSTGSILKPILYQKALEQGCITPYSLLPDIPVQYGAFSPKNYNKTFDGAVPADEALARSLNIPMVGLLYDYGMEKFHHDLQQMNIIAPKYTANHYGLPLILGGAETSAWQITNAYLQMARTARDLPNKSLNVFSDNNANYVFPKMDKACVMATFEAMTNLNRPDEEGNWKVFESSKKIAWKTGTSFGGRDAWAIGITPDYVVTVWTGNADGTGRPGLAGIKTSAPILFDLFSILPAKSYWFRDLQSDEITKVGLCKKSGRIASTNCDLVDSVAIPSTCLVSTCCSYHKKVLLDKSKQYIINNDCPDFVNGITTTFFVLPPLMEKFYKLKHQNFIPLPPYHHLISNISTKENILLMYPKNQSKIVVPKLFDETIGNIVFEATHKNLNTKIYWHLDEQLIGETQRIHQVLISPTVGPHHLHLVDEFGNSAVCQFEVVRTSKE